VQVALLQRRIQVVNAYAGGPQVLVVTWYAVLLKERAYLLLEAGRQSWRQIVGAPRLRRPYGCR